METAQNTSTSNINIICLGGASEVGRSCVVIENGRTAIMLDCGIHPAFSGIGCLPIYDAYDISKIDLCLITHFHMDHSGALPYLVNKTRFKGKVYMTEATKSICYLLWKDYARIEKCIHSVRKNRNIQRKGQEQDDDENRNYHEGGSGKSEGSERGSGSGLDGEDGIEDGIHGDDNALYDEEDIERTMDLIETLNFHQNLEYKNVKFTAYRAGHVLGACMFLVELNNVRFLYTGDYSREIDRHIPIAEIPPIDVHVLICEGTYGIRVHDDRRKREKRFLEMVTSIVEAKGKCLLPVFALGRTQELLLIMEEHWNKNDHLKNIPIFYISQMATKSLHVYESFINLCGAYVKKQVAGGKNPFQFKYVRNIKSLEQIMPYLHKDHCPCVILASPGMLQNGVSRTIFHYICSDKKSGVILTGYTVKGTLADELKTEPDFVNINDKVVKRKCRFDMISFSAHSDFNQTSTFIEKLKCPNVVLVHGDKNELNRLKNKLSEEKSYLSVFTPEILQRLTFQFEQNDFLVSYGSMGKKIADVFRRNSNLTQEKKNKISSLTNELKEDDEEDTNALEGIIVSEPMKVPILISRKEIQEFTNLSTAFIEQTIHIKFPYNFESLYGMLCTIYEDVVLDGDVIQVKDIKLIFEKESQIISLNWLSSPCNDLIADSINFLLLEYINTMNSNKKVPICNEQSDRHVYDMILSFIEENYTNIERIPTDDLKNYALKKKQETLLEPTEEKEDYIEPYENIIIEYMIENYINNNSEEKENEDDTDEINEILKFHSKDMMNQDVNVYVDMYKREVICSNKTVLSKIKELLRNIEESLLPMCF